VNEGMFHSVSDAAAFLAGDEQVKALVEQEIAGSQIVNSLIQQRMGKKVSQKELAQRMGCDPSKISRMEAGNDAQLKIGDVTHYLTAIGVQMSMIFEDAELPAAERIKRHVFAIHEQLERLVDIAKQVDGDDSIIKKIREFYGEVLLNFMLRFSDSHQKLSIVSECTASHAVQTASESPTAEQESTVKNRETQCCSEHTTERAEHLA